MISKNDFNNIIEDILSERSIESIPIDNIELIKEVIFDDKLNKKLYKGFINEYKFLFGEDDSYVLMKLQDILYRIHILLNKILIDKYDKNVDDIDLFRKLINNGIDESTIYDAVSYDNSDIKEIEIEMLDYGRAI